MKAIAIAAFGFFAAMIVIMYRQLNEANRQLSLINHNLLNFRSAVKDYIEAQAEIDHNRDIVLTHIRNNGKALLDLFAKMAKRPSKKPKSHGKDQEKA